MGSDYFTPEQMKESADGEGEGKEGRRKEEEGEMDGPKPPSIGGSSVMLHLQFPSGGLDSAWERIMNTKREDNGEGAKVVMKVKEQFWGDRYGQLKDPFGFYWSLGETAKKQGENEGESEIKNV